MQPFLPKTANHRRIGATIGLRHSPPKAKVTEMLTIEYALLQLIIRIQQAQR